MGTSVLQEVHNLQRLYYVFLDFSRKSVSSPAMAVCAYKVCRGKQGSLGTEEKVGGKMIQLGEEAHTPVLCGAGG